MSEVVLGSF